MRIPEAERWLATAKKQIGHLFPELPLHPGYWKRRANLVWTIERLIAVFAAECPGADDLVLIDSTPVECGRSIETTRRSALGPGARMATAQAIPGTSGACVCPGSSAPTALLGRWLEHEVAGLVSEHVYATHHSSKAGPQTPRPATLYPSE